MADLLSDYETEVRRLLHDANANYWSNTDLDDYINQARNHVVTDTGCLRTLQSLYIQGGTEFYVFGGVWAAVLTNVGSGYTSAPTVTITGGGGTGATATASINNGTVSGVSIGNQGTGYTGAPTIAFSGGGGANAAATAYACLASTADIINFTVIWGSQRCLLQGAAWTELNAVGRLWTQYKYRPGMWSPYSNGAYVAPIPDQQYQVELDTVILPTALSGATTGPMVLPAIEAVPYWAAYLAKLNEKQYDEAQAFKQLYFQQINWANNIYTARMQSVYSGNANLDIGD